MPENTDTSDDEQTQSTQTRWAYTNDLLAALVLVTLCGVVAASLWYRVSVGDRVFTVFATIALIAAIWTFGKQAVTALAKLKP